MPAERDLVIDAATGLYICREPDCGKQFTRKDHLARHAVNHEEPQYFCDGCPKAFKRLDLLVRHVNRKLCATSGIIPEQTGPSEPDSVNLRDIESEEVDIPRKSARLSTSSRTSTSHQNPQEPSPKRPKTRGKKRGPQGPNILHHGPHALALLNDTPVITRPSRSVSPAPLLQPRAVSDTFGQEQYQHRMLSHHELPQPPPQPSQPPQHFATSPWQHHFPAHSTHPPQPHPPPQRQFSFDYPALPQTAHAMQAVHQPVDPFISPPVQNASFSAPPSTTVPELTYGFDTSQQLEEVALQQWGFNQIIPAPWDPLPSNGFATPLHDPQVSLDMTQWATDIMGAHVGSPVLSDLARCQESAERGASAVCDSYINAGTVALLHQEFADLRMQLELLNDAVQSYWTNVAPSFPFIHRGIFNPSDTTPHLLAMMAITGAAHFPHPRPDYSKTVQQIRGALVQQCGLEMPITTLQAFCLCHVYDTWHGTSDTIFLAQCTWPIMVAHSRKKGIGVQDASKRTTPSDMDGIEEEAELKWIAWAQDEERRRAAFCVLLIDTQISAFWNQHPSRQLSIFAHHIGLPRPKSEWEATSAADWLRAIRMNKLAKELNTVPQMDPSRPDAKAYDTHGYARRGNGTQKSPRKYRSSFLPSLHPDFQLSYVSEGYSSSLMSALAAETALSFDIDLNHSLSVQMILIGLCAAAWDLRTRGGMGIKLTNNEKSWRVLVLHAVVNLRAAWESSIASLPSTVETRDMRDTFALSIICVLSDIPMLQVAAGATSICGATILSRQHRDARRRLRIWVKSHDAFTCLWQSARYLRSALTASWGIYSSWAVYLTTLVVWAHAWPNLQPGTALSAPLPPSQQEQSAQSLLTRITDSPSTPYSFDGISELIVWSAGKVGGSGEAVGVECGDLLRSLMNLPGGDGRSGTEMQDGTTGSTPSINSSRHTSDRWA